jgi:glycosyltransferase involved in cell wall biosynthesis
MRILYAALDQTVPGTLGGSVHVQSVAEGLAALGHDVHVATRLREPLASLADWSGRLTWHAMSPPLERPALRWMRSGQVARLARTVGAEVVIERYYNFGGEGVLAARKLGVPAVLEVNAPIVDHPGSRKAALDRALLFEPMRRWRDHLCRLTDLFVTPSAAILPSWIDRTRILEVEWGADTHRFQPADAATPPPFARDPARIWCVFAGAFRAWHGAIGLASALAELHRAGEHRFGGLFVGDGPERAAVERAAAGVPGVIFAGAVPHDRMPAFLAACDIGVAPFDAARHPPLQLDFFWSPLKVFEYMASGLPVVTPRLPRLAQLVHDGREGLLYDPEDGAGLRTALLALANRARRHQMGAAARARAVREFSWDAHCRLLDERLRGLSAQRDGRGAPSAVRSSTFDV